MHNALFRLRPGIEALSARSLAALPDIGNIAIVDDSDGAVVLPAPFDLHNRTLHFSPSGAGAAQYTAATAALAYDDTAGQNGIPLTGLRDDDTQLLRLPFSFPFYGARYELVYLNSDGNLTFTLPDTAITARSLSRAVFGPPRIFPFFQDLDPSRTEAKVSYFSGPDRVAFTWDRVPRYVETGIGARQSFQATLYPDGRIAFHYREITINDAVVGIAPGESRNGTTASDFSEGVAAPTAGALAEIFSATTQFDEGLIARKFYLNHDDAYDYLVLFNNRALPASLGFAYELNIRNRARGLGLLQREDPVFDHGAEFGSPLRLQSFLNMGPLSNYPANPTDLISVFGASRNTPLTILGQESGHRFLAFPRYLDPLTNQISTGLLGRSLAHWSFYFNSDASVVEGNRIEDRGEGQSPRFRTVATNERYSALDQYLMGLRPPGEVPPSFLVRNPLPGGPAGRSPQAGVEFDGSRQEIPVESIINAEGRRWPDSTVAQKHFRYAFLLLVRQGTQPSADELAQLERLREEWERFFAAAVDNRGTATTRLVRQLRLSTWPAGGVWRGNPGLVTVSLPAAPRADVQVLLAADSSAITIPGSVTILAGRTSASFPVTGSRLGVAELTARVADPSYEVSRTIVQVREDATQLRLEIVSGANQRGSGGGLLGEPVVWRLRDDNDVSFSGVNVRFTAGGDGVVTPAQALTDAEGRVRSVWRLASTDTDNTLRAALEAAPSVSAVVTATAAPRPQFTAAGVVNAASFNAGPAGIQPAIVPGGLVSIFGTSLAAETRAAGFFPLPLALSSSRVTLNGMLAPLLYVSPGQVNLQAPFELFGPTVELAVSSSGADSAPVALPLASAQPGIFFNAVTGLGAIVHDADGKPTTERPARAGDDLRLYAAGLGAVLPPVASGFPAPSSPLSLTRAQPQVAVAGRLATVLSSNLLPGLVGVYQVRFRAPEGLPPGRQGVILTISAVRSNEVFLVIE